MANFNDVLQKSRIDPDEVLLVRHKDTRPNAKTTPYDLWLNKTKEFELYQRLQSKDRFSIGKFLASFVVTPKNETLFAGFYKVVDMGTPPMATVCPVLGRNCTEHILYEIEPREELKEYVSLLSIDWGKGTRSWVQYADRNEKLVLQNRKKTVNTLSSENN